MAESKSNAPGFIACPQCAAAVHVDHGWVSWCERCGWNVDPVPKEAPRTVVEKLWRRLNLRHRKTLFEELKQRAAFAKRWTCELFLAIGIAALVHATSFAMVALGLWWTFTQPWGILPALLVWLLAWGIAPRWPRVPKDALDEKAFPALYALVRGIGASVGLRPVRQVVLDERWNAWFAEAGLRLSPVVGLGVPLCAALENDELIALLGHEVAHGVNADSRRSFWVGGACATMERWWVLLDPREFWPGARAAETEEIEAATGVYVVAQFFANVFLWVIAQVPRAGAVTLTSLLYRDSQRAEYCADEIGARVAGTDAMKRMLAKLRLESVFALEVQRMALREPRGGEFIVELKHAIGAVPAREMARLARVDSLREINPDYTHPPTHLRIAMLESRMNFPPSFHLDAPEAAAIRAELQRVEARIRRRLVDNYLISVGS